jgi:Ca-activated chloride channel family protein
LAVVSFIAGTAYLAAQLTLRVDVDLVNVFLTTQNSRGDFITDLEKNDFVVYDDNQPQTISVFEKQDAVQSAIGILIDNSGSMVDIIPAMQRGIREFTRTFNKPAEIFLMSFGTTVSMLHGATQPQKHLEQVLEGIRAWGTSKFYDGMVEGLNEIGKSPHQRKALVVFTDGDDNGSHAGRTEVIASAQRAGALLYFIAIGSPVLIDHNTLDALATLSGGQAFYLPKSEPVSPILEKIRAELSKQYYIGYYVPHRPGYHRIRIETPGHPFTIHAKTGYLSD